MRAALLSLPQDNLIETIPDKGAFVSRPGAQEAREVFGLRRPLIAMLYRSSNDPHCSSDEHESFLRLCRSRDTEAAVASMNQHLVRIEASLGLSDGCPDRQFDLVRALLA